ncbi:molecular chaperone DjlA [Oecophyllibacter saccharovorans]|uniref:TerB family tellurite resistance protein n=1 Tax=Oecophyllibacter saccharovorans TaxID=2558360 RepID=UPI00114336C1|nr:TerB family tellurite resistance protein [Oecophyllibacter saccharovorans]QDH14851.1 molecular chaperone DjlA [Oecophyllibacter saccharovorans]
MAVWGKIFGGVAGLATGGPVGGLLGLTLGHMADKKKLLTPISGTWGERFTAHGTPDPNNAAFFTAAKLASLLGKRDQLFGLGVIALCAKMAKIDGPVTRREVDAFKGCFHFPPEHQREVGLMFDRARERTDDYAMYADEMGKAYRGVSTEPLESLLGALFRIARADLPPHAPLNPQEMAFLRRVHQGFGLSQAAWERAESGQARAASAPDAPDAYRVLGIARSASDTDVRLRWRALVREHHPDVLAARQGLTPTQHQAALERIARINAAWDQIKRDRGI